MVGEQHISGPVALIPSTPFTRVGPMVANAQLRGWMDIRGRRRRAKQEQKAYFRRKWEGSEGIRMMEEVFRVDHLAQERSKTQSDVDAMKIVWAWLQARLPCRRPHGSTRRQRSGLSPLRSDLNLFPRIAKLISVSLVISWWLALRFDS